MNIRISQRNCFVSGNFFRADWMYQRLAAGDKMLGEGKGLSPAFMTLLRAIDCDQPVSFGALGQRISFLHADDLELWLAELCRMGLIAPASQSEETPAVATVPAQAANGAAIATLEITPAAPVPAAIPAIPVPAPVPAAVVPITASSLPASDPLARTRPLAILPSVPAVPKVAGLSLGFDWKSMTLDALYAELLAICAELEEREKAPAALAA